MALLLVGLVCASLGSTVLAADARVYGPAFSDIAGDPAEFELTVMAALSIMSGDSGLGGPVRPNATITRAEMAKILVGALGYARMEPGMRAQPLQFKDAATTPSWAIGWINTAQALSLVGGYPDGTFRANNTVTYAEAVAMLIRCVFGHDEQVKATKVAWPTNYIAYGVTWGFTGDVVPYPSLPAIRGDIAKMIYATMQVNHLSGDGTERPNTSLLNGRVIKGTLTAYTGTSATITTTTGVTHTLADPYFLVGANSLDQMQNLEVLGILDKKTDGKWVLIQKLGSSTTTGGLSFVGLETSGTTDYLVFQGDRKIAYRNHVPTVLNNESGNDETDLEAGDVCQVVQGSDSYAVSITAWRYDEPRDYISSFTASHGSTDTYIGLANGHSYNIPSSCQVYLNGSTSGRDSLAKYDVIRLATLGAHGTTPVRVEATRRTVEGTVTNTSTSYPGPVIKVTISKTGGGTGTYVLDPTYITTVPSTDDRVKYGLDADNKLFVPLALTTTQPYVLIKGTETTSTGYSVTVDYRGATNVYTATVDLHDHVGKFGKLIFTSGKVSGFTPYPIGATAYDVLQHSASGATVKLDGGDTVKYIDNSTAYVYRYNSSTGSYTFIGTGGLVDGADEHVYPDTVGSTAVFWVYIP